VNFIKRHHKSFHALIILLTIAVNLSAFTDYSKAVSNLSFVREWGMFGTTTNTYPLHTVFSPSGKLYVADANIHKISVFASNGDFLFQFGQLGNEAGEFNYPWNIAADANSNIYVTDSGNNRIQVFNADGDFLFSFGASGDGDGQFNAPRGIAINSLGQVYVADSLNHRIQIFDANGNFLDKFGVRGTADGEMKYPEAITFDQMGNLLVADNGNSRINVYLQNGSFVRSFGSYGSGDGEFMFPTDVDVALNGNIYVVGASDHRVQIFDQLGNYLSEFDTILGSASYSSAQSVSISGDGILYSADAGNHLIQYFPVAGVPQSTYFDYDQGWVYKTFNSPTGIAISKINANYYIADTGNHRIKMYDGVGEYQFDFGERGNGDGQFYYPEDVAVDEQGNLFVVDDYNRIQVFSDNGVFERSFAAPGSGDGEINRARGLAFGPGGKLYVADTNNNRIQVFAADGTFIKTYGAVGSGVGEFLLPHDIAVDNEGIAYIADTGNNRIQIINLEDESVSGVIGYSGSGSGAFQSPKGVDVDAGGNIYVSSSGNNRVQVFTSQGLFITAYGTVGDDEGEFSEPFGIVVTDAGMLTVVDSNNHRIQQLKINDAAVVTPPIDPGSGGGSGNGGGNGGGGVGPTITEPPVMPIDPDVAPLVVPPVQTDVEAILPTILPQPVRDIIASTTQAVKKAVVEPARILIHDIEEVTPTPLKTYIPKTFMTSGLLVGSVAMVTDNLFAAPMSFSQLALLPARLWANFLTALGIRKRRRPWGTVYDSMTKQPIDPIYLELVNKEGFVVSKVMTDAFGRYSFKVAPGHYMLRPKKEGYIFPSLMLAHTTRDEIYQDLYFGNYFEVKQDNEQLSKNIPVDRTNINWQEFFNEDQKILNWLSRRDKIISQVSHVLFVVGFVIAVLALFLAPRPYSVIVFLLYVLMFAIKRSGVNPSRLGKVIDQNTKAPLAFAVVRIYSVKLGNEVMRKVTNKYGQFFCPVPDGDYYLSFDRKNPNGSYTEASRKELVQSRRGIVSGSWQAVY
jgi:DNA-binding beta-propeller fold protein YncE